MRNHLINELTRIAETRSDILILAGDLGYHVLDDFAQKFPSRYFNAGIAEQNMASVAAGLSLEGFTPCLYSTGCFPTLRCIEQIRNSICYHKANVKIIAVGGGFAYGQLGMSHHATEELAIMRALPNMTIFAPSDPREAECAIREALRIQGPCYLRLGRGGEKPLRAPDEEIDVYKIHEFVRGEKIAVIAHGSIVEEALAAVPLLKDQGIQLGVYNLISLKPIDEEGVSWLAQNYDTLISLEEHNVIGGLGTILADILSANGASKARLIKLGLQDEFTSVVGGKQHLRKIYHADVQAIVEECMKAIQNEYSR